MTINRKISFATSILAAVTSTACLVGFPATAGMASAANAPPVISGPSAPPTPNILHNGELLVPHFTGAYDFLKAGSGAIPGWSIGGGGVIVYGGGDVQPPPGATTLVHLARSGSGDIEQTVATTPGWTYLLKFWLGGRPGDQPIKTLHVLWGGALVATPSCNTSGKTLANIGWSHHSLVVTAGSTRSALEFADASKGYSSMVGNISLTGDARLFLPTTWTLKRTSGSLVAYVRSLSGAAITDPALKVRLYITWKPQPYAPPTTQQVAVSAVSAGQATLVVHMPSSLAGKTVAVTATLLGPKFIPVTRTVRVHVG